MVLNVKSSLYKQAFFPGSTISRLMKHNTHRQVGRRKYLRGWKIGIFNYLICKMFHRLESFRNTDYGESSLVIYQQDITVLAILMGTFKAYAISGPNVI